jgi:hypothetical protein
MSAGENEWPDLSAPDCGETMRTLHLWTQVVGKTKLALSPMINHWWQVPLYVTARGLSSSLIPFGHRGFDIELDLLSNRLVVRTSEGEQTSFGLRTCKLSTFYADYQDALAKLQLSVRLNPLACEVSDAVYLDSDPARRRYDPGAAALLHRALVRVDAVMKAFRGAFLGKVSPVHFFWGAFDLAVTRFSGRRAPPHPGGAPHVADSVMREAYSHEVSSAGFWPGGIGAATPMFYSYAYPEPVGFNTEPVLPVSAYYDARYREFLLPYEAVRQSSTPERDLLTFFQSTYEAAADLADWPRAELERHITRLGGIEPQLTEQP